jgi:hypothetical protein
MRAFDARGPMTKEGLYGFRFALDNCMHESLPFFSGEMPKIPEKYIDHYVVRANSSLYSPGQKQAVPISNMSRNW